MKEKVLYIIVVRIIAIIWFTLTLAQTAQSVFSLFYSFRFDFFYCIGLLFQVGISILIAFIIFKKAETIVSFFSRGKHELEEKTIMLSELKTQEIYKVIVFALGLTLLIMSLPNLISTLYHSFKLYIQSIEIDEILRRSLVENIVQSIIGFFFIFRSDSLVNFIQKKIYIEKDKD